MSILNVKKCIQKITYRPLYLCRAKWLQSINKKKTLKCVVSIQAHAHPQPSHLKHILSTDEPEPSVGGLQVVECLSHVTLCSEDDGL